MMTKEAVNNEGQDHRCNHGAMAPAGDEQLTSA
jgi:hypothetical protein